MTRTSKIDTSAFTVSPDAQKTRLHSPPQRPTQLRAIDAAEEFNAKIFEATFKGADHLPAIRSYSSDLAKELKTLRSRLQQLEGR